MCVFLGHCLWAPWACRTYRETAACVLLVSACVPAQGKRLKHAHTTHQRAHAVLQGNKSSPERTSPPIPLKGRVHLFALAGTRASDEAPHLGAHACRHTSTAPDASDADASDARRQARPVAHAHTRTRARAHARARRPCSAHSACARATWNQYSGSGWRGVGAVMVPCASQGMHHSAHAATPASMAAPAPRRHMLIKSVCLSGLL